MSYDKFAQYDAYKNSGVGWLSDVPEHWEVKRLKDISPKITTGSTPSKELFVESGFKWYTPGDFNNRLVLEQARKEVIGKPKTKIYPANSILIVSIGATLGKIGIAKNSFSANQQINIVYPAHSYFPFYLLYFLSASTDSMKASSNASTLGIMNQSKTGQLLVFIPPLQEQKAIVDYLDTKTAQIGRKIHLLTQKATQYGKLKQSLINETVTRGLDKTVAMKDSGVEWIGEVPEHWDVRRGKDLFDRKARPCFDDDEIVTAFRDGQVTLRLNRRVAGFTNAIKEHGYQQIQAGDLVIHAMDAFAGAIGVSDSTGKSSPVYSAYTAQDKETVYMPYYGKLLRQMALSGFISSLGKGIRERSTEFRHKQFIPLKLVVPPLKEQKAIADYLAPKTTHIDRIVETINTQIEKLKELRKTLINDVVTGKIKVPQ